MIQLEKTNRFYQRWLESVGIFLLSAGTLCLPLFYLPGISDVINFPKQLLLYVLISLGVMFWLFRLLFVRSYLIRRTVLDWPLVVFLLCLGISTFFSVVPSVSVFGRMQDFVLNIGTIILSVAWFWLFVQEVKRRSTWNIMLTLFLLSGALSSTIFLLARTVPFTYLMPTGLESLFSSANSVFALYLAIVLIISIGCLLIRYRHWLWQVIPFVAAVSSAITLILLGYTLPFIILAVGFCLLFMFGVLMIRETHLPVLVGILVLFVGSVTVSFVGVPEQWKRSLKTEVALGAETSWMITYDSITDSVPNFLFGTGPGTFLHSFSQYRPEAFNSSVFVRDYRFAQPYSTMFALISEIGVLGSLVFVVVCLVALGSVVSAWLQIKQHLFARLRLFFQKEERLGEDFTAYLEVFVVATAWVAATVGLCLTFYDLAMWWVWWWLLAMMFVGLAAISPTLIKKKSISFDLSPQYVLAFSFGLMVLFSAFVLGGVYGAKFYLADVAYAKATETTVLTDAQRSLQSALMYRPGYAVYHVELAKMYLQQAKQESEKGVQTNPEQLATLLSLARDEAEIATQLEPNDVNTWETLAAMYLNIRSLTADANDWAKEALLQAVALEPTNAIYEWRLAGVYAFSKQSQQASASYKRAIQLQPDNLLIQLEYAEFLELDKKEEQALAVYTELVAGIGSKQPEVYFNLGKLYFNRDAKGDIILAKQAWEQAVTLMPDYSNALYSLGLVHERMGDRKTALQYYQKVQALNPDNVDVKKKLQTL